MKGFVGLIANILFPVDFSHSCEAMGPYVKRAAAIFKAKVSLIHVFNPVNYSGVEDFVRGPVEIAEEHREIAHEKLNLFLKSDFPVSQFSRILTWGDVTARIAIRLFRC